MLLVWLRRNPSSKIGDKFQHRGAQCFAEAVARPSETRRCVDRNGLRGQSLRAIWWFPRVLLTGSVFRPSQDGSPLLAAAQLHVRLEAGRQDQKLVGGLQRHAFL